VFSFISKQQLPFLTERYLKDSCEDDELLRFSMECVKKEMKFIIFVLALSSFLLLSVKPVMADDLDLVAESAILLDFTTGKVLLEKNAHIPRPPASTTKIMTALIALERGDLNQKIVTSANASRVGGSSIYLKPGDQYKLEEMLYGLMLSSGNDAAVAVAENLAGSEEQYAAWMTEKAKLLGAKATTFLNSSGMPKPGHLTTAYDLAIITRYALNNPLFDKIVKTKQHSLLSSLPDDERILNNHNKLLWRYQYADGVKTGYTREAGRCLVASATRNGHRLIAVVLNSKKTYEDVQKMFEYGFQKYQLLNVVSTLEKLGEIPVVMGAKGRVPVLPNRNLTLLLPKGKENDLKVKLELKKFIQAPVARFQRVGEVQVKLGEEIIDQIPVIAAMDVPRRNFSLFERLLGWMRSVIN
jgi:D-alanyl-D-alanine carboxypeptidase (penicillin-binding protein 5/6)